MTPSQPLLYARQERARINTNMKNELHSHDQDHFGHKLRKKKHHITRILVCNPNGLTGPQRTQKIEQIKIKAIAYELDILCITEQNQNLKRIPVHHQLRQVTQGWWEARRVTQAYNQHFDSGKEQQIGGVSIVATNTLAHRSTFTNNDPTGLGRWTSMLLSGKKGISTRIVCAYRPCKSNGPDTAYIQQALYFNSIGRKGDPRKLFMEDLAQTIKQWQHLGEKIILTGDFNTGDKNTQKKLSQFWNPWLKQTGLINAHQQSSTHNIIPSTHERGQVQIDYMFISPDLSITRAGFLPFSKFPGDHRALWIDLKSSDIIGLHPQQLSMANARRLTLRDPRIVKRYLQELKKRMQNLGTVNTLDQLSHIPPDEWTSNNTEEFENAAYAFRSAMLIAEHKCRKFRTGAHPWSPTLDKARKMKFFWETKVKELLGLHVPKKKLIKLQK